MSKKENKTVKISDPLVALAKAQRWCAYQERCQQEVRDKLYDFGLHSEVVEHLISDLITSGFLNEERFAKAYAGGKFRIKKWGRIKIKLALKQKKVSDYCIKKGLAEIDEKDYRQTLKKLAAEKLRLTADKNPLRKKFKVMQYLAGKGYEQELIRELFADDE